MHCFCLFINTSTVFLVLFFVNLVNVLAIVQAIFSLVEFLLNYFNCGQLAKRYKSFIFSMNVFKDFFPFLLYFNCVVAWIDQKCFNIFAAMCFIHCYFRRLIFQKYVIVSPVCFPSILFTPRFPCLAKTLINNLSSSRKCSSTYCF